MLLYTQSVVLPVVASPNDAPHHKAYIDRGLLYVYFVCLCVHRMRDDPEGVLSSIPYTRHAHAATASART